MSAFGVVVIAVLAGGILVALVLARTPVDWDELGGSFGAGDAPSEPAGAAPPPSRADDEAQLRALLAAKRAARRARDGLPEPEEPQRPLAQGPPWAHLDSEVVDEARALVRRRRERLQRQGKAPVAEHAELERLLGPPHV